MLRLTIFYGYIQTLQILIRHRILRCLIRIFVVCLQNVLLEFGKVLKKPPNIDKIINGLVLLTMVSKLIWLENAKIKYYIRLFITFIVQNIENDINFWHLSSTMAVQESIFLRPFKLIGQVHFRFKGFGWYFSFYLSLYINRTSPFPF